MVVGLTPILNQTCNTAANAEDKQALSLAKECCSMKLDLNRSTEAATIW